MTHRLYPFIYLNYRNSTKEIIITPLRDTVIPVFRNTTKKDRIGKTQKRRITRHPVFP